MISKPGQIPLDLGHRAAFEREDLWVSTANAGAVGWLDKYPDWGAPALIVYGPSASGKTHLAKVWQKKTGAPAMTPENAETLCAVSTPPSLLLLDDAESLIGDECAEKFLFHAYNSAKEKGGGLLLTAERAPKEWGFVLADLKSRLLAAPAVAISPPDEQLMSIVLVKLFSDRQIFVPQEVVQFITSRIERSFKALSDTVDAIDKQALAEKRAVTIPLVREILQAQGVFI